MKILAIDDIRENHILLKELLAISFPQAILISAMDGLSGIDFCKSELPDVVVLDIMMPGIDGFEVCRRIKSDSQLKHIPVLMMTAAHSDRIVRINALESGADAFLAKPLEESELTAQLRAMMRIKKSEDRKKTEKKRLEILVQRRTEALSVELKERKIAEGNLKKSNIKLEKSYLVLNNLTKKLKNEINERLKAEEKVKEHLREQLIISEFSKKLVILNHLDDVYSHVGNTVYEIIPESIVILSNYDENIRTIQKKDIYSLEEQKQYVLNLCGSQMFKTDFKLSDISAPEIRNLKKMQLLEITENFNYFLFDKTFTAKIWKKISNDLKLGFRYTIAFIWEGVIYGGLNLLTHKKISFSQKKLIETLVNQSSVVIQKLFTEKKLVQSEKLYRSLVETSPDGIAMCNLQGEVVAINQKLIDLFGYKDESHFRHGGKKFFDLLYGVNSHEFQKTFLNFDKNESIESHEYHGIKKDDQLFPIEINTSVLFDNFNVPYGFISIIRDITLRKQVENALKENRELYKLLADKMSDVVWLMSLDGVSTFVSPSIFKFTGYSVEEYLIQKIDDRFTAESAFLAKRIFAKELNRYHELQNLPEDYNLNVQLEYKCKNGGTKWGELVITPLYDNMGLLVGIHGVTRDIDERKLVEKSLLESEEKYRLLTNNMGDILSLFDISGVLLYINNSVQLHLGYAPHSLLGKNLIKLLTQQDYQKIKSFIKKGDFSKIPKKPFINQFRCKDGTFIWFETNVLALKNQDGNIDRVQCVSRNITEKIENEKKLEEERHNVLTALIDGQEIERQRISMELHDGLGQKLAGIKMKLENSSNLNLEKTRTVINEVKTEFWNIIDEIRMISNNVSPAILSQWGFTSSLSELLKQYRSSTGLAVDFSVIGNFDKIFEKKAFYLYRIVQEALTNISKHAKASTIKVALIEKENYLLILIEDNGCGFKYEKDDFIIGNGLKNMKQRAVLLKGDVIIESELGAGTVICVRIPK